MTATASSLQRSVLDPDLQRIVQALTGRTRYHYVQPVVQPVPAREGGGWVIVSPNCSRQVDARGGTIPIAWLAPADTAGTHWQLHARNHAAQRWVLLEPALSLDAALQRICQDPLGRFWP